MMGQNTNSEAERIRAKIAELEEKHARMIDEATAAKDRVTDVERELREAKRALIELLEKD